MNAYVEAFSNVNGLFHVSRRRMTALLLAVVLLIVLQATPGGRRSPEGLPSRLEGVLKSWSSSRQAARESHYQLSWTILGNDPFDDKKRKEVWHSEAFLQRPDRLRFEMKNDEGKDAYLVLMTGGKARVYFFDGKRELLLSLPDGYHLPQLAERCLERKKIRLPGSILEGIVWSILGPPHGNLKVRFVPRLEKEDAHWSYLRLQPRTRFGWLSDEEWQVVLHRREGWVRRVSSSQPNGSCLIVDLERPEHQPLRSSTWDRSSRSCRTGGREVNGPYPSQSWPARRASGSHEQKGIRKQARTIAFQACPPPPAYTSSVPAEARAQRS